MVALCDDEAVIGSEFYVMERLDGHDPAARLPGLDARRPSDVATLCRDAVDVLVDLHAVDVAAAGARRARAGARATSRGRSPAGPTGYRGAAHRRRRRLRRR